MTHHAGPVRIGSCTNELVAAFVNIRCGYGCLLVCSAYPFGDKSGPSEELAKVIKYANNYNAQLFIGYDANAHHTSWGSTGSNARVDQHNRITEEINNLKFIKYDEHRGDYCSGDTNRSCNLRPSRGQRKRRR
ncbi:hypothetical protein evm_001262 [Chilo suppressalis]|nr:hypothetical protein evm_001262 [Chilo suppressalis]